MVRGPRRLLPGRLLRLLALAGRTDGRRHRSRGRVRPLGRTRAPGRVPQLAALPGRRDRRSLRLAGPPPLLCLLGGHAHPALRAHRRLGRAGGWARPTSSSPTRSLGLAAHARGDHRRRARERDVRHDRARRQGTSTWIFLGFAAAFAVKAPLWPFHGWLPDAYREAPAEVAALLSGVVSKTAAYGFLAIAIPFYPGPADDWRTPILVLASIGLVYGSLVAFRAPDVRGVIAYSSLAQMNLIVIGIFAVNASGYTGALLADGQPRAHLGGALPARGGNRAPDEHRRAPPPRRDGRGRPRLATILITTGVIALAVPCSSAFAAEFLVLNGIFDIGWGWAVVGADRDRPRRDVHAPADLRRPPRGRRQRRACREALDLRPAEVGVIAPLVVPCCSSSPSGRPGSRIARWRRAGPGVSALREGVRRRVTEFVRPDIDWYALSPTLVLLGRCRRPPRRRVPPAAGPDGLRGVRRRLCFVAAGTLLAFALFAVDETGRGLVRDSLVGTASPRRRPGPRCRRRPPRRGRLGLAEPRACP